MDSRIPVRDTGLMARRFARRTVVQGFGLAGALALGSGIAGWRDSGAAQLDALPAEWFRTDDNCADDATCGLRTQVIFGDGPVSFSHLPLFMFDSPGNYPHHYQVITEIALPDAALEAYLADREATGAPLYTLKPTETYRMLDLAAGSLSETPVDTLSGDIVRGHWERPARQQPFGIDLAAIELDVAVAVDRVIYAHEFALHQEPLARLEYVLFGSGDQLFLAHRVTAAPDFDQLLPVTIESGTFSNAQLRSGLILAIPERQNTIADRLVAGEQVMAEAWHGATGVALTARDGTTGSPVSAGIQLVAGPEFFFEEGELAEFSTMRPTEEEIASGFAFP